MKNLSILFQDGPPSTCKGHWYTFRRNVYRGKRGEIVSKEYFTKIKSISCKGCINCGGLDEMLDLEMSEGRMIPFPVDLDDQDTVMLTTINDGRNFEDLYDEYHLEFVKAKRGNHDASKIA